MKVYDVVSSDVCQESTTQPKMLTASITPKCPVAPCHSSVHSPSPSTTLTRGLVCVLRLLYKWPRTGSPCSLSSAPSPWHVGSEIRAGHCLYQQASLLGWAGFCEARFSTRLAMATWGVPRVEG